MRDIARIKHNFSLPANHVISLIDHSNNVIYQEGFYSEFREDWCISLHGKEQKACWAVNSILINTINGDNIHFYHKFNLIYTKDITG